MTKQKKYLFEPTGDHARGTAEKLAEMLNAIAAELSKMGFSELAEPENMDRVLTDPLAAVEAAIIRRVKREGGTLGGLPMSNTGILSAVEMPDMAFFRGGWKPPEPLWLDLCKFGRIVAFDPGARRYMVDGKALEEKVSRSGILASPENMALHEKLQAWVSLSNEIGFTNGDFRDKLGKNLAHPHGHAYLSRALFELAAGKRRTMASRAK